MKLEQNESIIRYVKEAVTEVLNKPQLQFVSSERNQEWIDEWPQTIYTSIIGFQGLLMHGSIILCCEREFLLETMPFRDKIVPAALDSAAQDWLGEMTNLMIGNISNKLLRHGISVKISPPSVAIAPATIMESYAERVPAHNPFWFALEGDRRLCVQFAADIDKNVVFGDTKLMEPPVRPGSMVRFTGSVKKSAHGKSVGELSGVSWASQDGIEVEFDSGATLILRLSQMPAGQKIIFQFSGHSLGVLRDVKGISIECGGMAFHLPHTLDSVG